MYLPSAKAPMVRASNSKIIYNNSFIIILVLSRVIGGSEEQYMFFIVIVNEGIKDYIKKRVNEIKVL